MRRGILVCVSTAFGLVLSCGAFTEGADPGPDPDGGGATDAVAGGDVSTSDALGIADVAPSDGNPCSSRAAKFGGDDFFEANLEPPFDPLQMTVEAWIYVPTSAAAKPMPIVSHVASDMNAGWTLGLTPGPNLIFSSFSGGLPEARRPRCRTA